MIYGKARKGSTVEISRKIGPGKGKGGFSPGQFGKIIRARKQRGYDAYMYELEIDDALFGWFDERVLTKGRHTVRYRDREGVWRCDACQRKVKAPLPCPACGEYQLEFRATRYRPAYGKPQLLKTYQGQRVCHPCGWKLPRKNKTDTSGNALGLGDMVRIVAAPLDCMSFIGKRATVKRRGSKSVTIEFADGSRYSLPYEDLARVEGEPTLPGEVDATMMRAIGQINQAFAKALS